MVEMHFKDKILDSLAEKANVAQFVSYDPVVNQRFSRVFGVGRNYRFETLELAVDVLLARSAERSVNVRSFDPTSPKSREFVYGLKSKNEVAETVRRLAREGLYTIINETIDVSDGGVSGVQLGEVIEFSPDDTPRCVEKPGTAAFPRDKGLQFLETVYGFKPRLAFPQSTRVEFSLHPIRRGVRNDHTIIWELEEIGRSAANAEIRWPNRFSELIGDKAFGLIVADLYNLSVPRTIVISRRLAPFTFGRPTKTAEPWIRTAPRVQLPGKFTTKRGWLDPFRLLASEDPSMSDIASVLYQEGVDAEYSGAAIAAEMAGGPAITIEGTSGYGDEFMVGTKKREVLPARISQAVSRLYSRVFKQLGYVRFEWVASAKRIWIVQFHRGSSVSYGRVVFPGEASQYVRFEVADGLEALRALIGEMSGKGQGIILKGDVGITSHFGDVIRKAQIPSMIED